MQHELHHIVQSLLGRRHLEEVTGDNLAELVREHPYSPILHLLYSKKLQQSQDPRFAESVAQTALYFSNPHWLHNLLRPKTGREATRALEQAFEEKRQESRPAETIAAADVRSAWEQPDLRQMPQESAAFSAELQPAGEADWEIHNPFEQPGQPEQSVQEEISDSREEFVVSPSSETAPEEANVPTASFTASAQDDTAPSAGFAQSGAAATASASQDETSPSAGSATSEQQTLPEPGEAQETVQPVPETAVKIPMAGTAQPVDAGLIPLEPLYTIDYFASQGIQRTEEEKQDPLGRKLKSFTEWLKTMKKVHPTKAPMALDVQQEDRIKENAEHSNDQSEVVTEAMAEVYLKQGMKHRAIAVYQKLSLLNPGQSASFAAKIADLNAPQS